MRAIRSATRPCCGPATFSLEGRAIRKVRQSVSRLTKAGYRFRVVAADDVGERCARSSSAVSAAWRGEQARARLLDGDGRPLRAGHALAVAEDADGRVGGFLHLAPSPAAAAGRSARCAAAADTPNGLMEFLSSRRSRGRRRQGATELSLNFCALADFFAPERATRSAPPVAPRAARGRPLFQLERLHSFSRKFHPEWRPRYLCVERLSDLPLVGLAYLRVEQLLVAARAVARRDAAVSH